MNGAERSLLSAALRARPETIDELASLVELPVEQIRALVDEMACSGLLSRSGDRLHYVQPDRHVADRLSELAERQQQRMGEDLEELRALAADLPGLVGDWFAGATADVHALQVEVLHGPDSGTELWRRQLHRGIPAFAEAMLPDLHRFRLPDDSQARFIDSMSVDGRAARAIVSTADAQDPAIAVQLPRFQRAGLQIRMHPDPPSWFWIHDDVLVGIPLTWGERWPTSVMALHSKPIAAMLGQLFTRVWNESVPAIETDRSWTSLLQLMRDGATLDAASRALGIAPRTGRRRIAAAMEHYGAQTLFGLGAAWAAGAGPDTRR